MLAGFLVVLMPAVYMQIICVANAVRDMKKELFRTFMRSSLENSGHSGEGIAAINTDSDTASGVFDGPLFMFLNHTITIVFSSVTVFIIDWRLGLSALGVGLIAFIAQHRFTSPVARISKERLNVNAASVKSVSNIFSGALTIRAFNLQDRAVVTFDKDNGQLRVLDIRRAFIAMLQGLFGTVQGWLSMVVVFALGGWLVATGQLEFYMLLMAPMMCSSIARGFGSIGQAYADLQTPIVAAKRVFKILEDGESQKQKTMERQRLGAANQTVGDGESHSGYRLSMENLSFTYLDGETQALRDINLDIAENQMIALVGESGSGKSTLLRTIIGMYERDDLGMTLGGQCFNDTSLRGWRRNFAYVDQSCKLFDMSIQENIALGRGEAPTSTQQSQQNPPPESSENSAAPSNVNPEILAAAKRAAAHDFIVGLEGGYDAPCGEKGGTLSGGQKQRIAIARALVKKAPVLVFDEATSALDTESERYVMETIESLRSDHTVLITTHNLETITTADKIVVMDKGSISAIGTHQELMDAQGLYFRLFTQGR